MKRKDFIKRLGLSTAVVAASSQLYAASKEASPKKVYFHYLLFWLKPDLDKNQIEEFSLFFEGLKKLPYVKNLRYGKAADSSPRAVLDNSFTYNASMEFASLHDLEAYGKLPQHIALVEKYKPFFNRMLVHDSVYENK
ncbi:Dabb family protein [Sphingobacterium sp. LRF_L2]|uniref:Dabb family protein n=1 Tax=Sphingobacterium sp. LRF_L2 TaxID=3369421 RepID=UPI003F5EC7BD